jgi:geranylgeranyl diphosphate synthase type II
MQTELSTHLSQASPEPVTMQRVASAVGTPAGPAATTQAVLDRVLADGAAQAAQLGDGFCALWADLTSATQGGKRFRPELFGATYRAWGGADVEAAATVGAAIELLHTAFIVHDDVIDEDELRRGRPNVAGAHARTARAAGVPERQAGQFGVTAGILAGDLALATSLKVVATCAVPVPTVARLLDLFHHVLLATAAGELADVWMSVQDEPSPLADVLTMEERKTALYSFALPMQAGAVLAGAPAAMVDAVGRVGRALGIAFQLADDLDGVFGDVAVTGKSSLSDLRAGKHTPLVAHARTTGTWHEIAPLVGCADLTDAQAQEVRACLTACGSRRFVEELADDHAAMAVHIAADAGLPAALVDTVRSFGEDLVGRAA